MTLSMLNDQQPQIDRDALDVHQLLGRTSLQHRSRFGKEATLLAAAPGRVNLIGEHTDYNDGFVFPMGIERYVVIAASISEQSLQRIVVYSDAVGETAEIPLSSELRPDGPGWSNYVRGVVAGFLRRGYAVGSLELTINSNVPLGSGLSSSAALEVATASILEVASGRRLDPLEKALICQAAEHEFASVPCGLMDQLASVFSRRNQALFIDCLNSAVTYVPFDNPQVSILICNSNTRHSLAASAYSARRAECERAALCLGKRTLREATFEDMLRDGGRLEATLLRRARHVITENQRVLEFADAVNALDFAGAGRLMYESHASLRDDFEVSCRELDVLVDLAQELGIAAGVYGSRMTGGGFGGCTVSLIRLADTSRLVNQLAAGYQAQTGKVADIFVTRPGEGLVQTVASR